MDLIEAVERNDVESVKAIIAGGGGADFATLDGVGVTALYWASYKGFVECVKVLLEAKADTEKAEENGYTPLHVASLGGRLECVKV
jgi:ankyrin repeat protein